jgi:excisionase family DNA binding protein
MPVTTAVAKAKPAVKRGKAATKKAKRTPSPLLENQRIYSIPEGAAAAGVSTITFWRAIYAGHLKTYRAGRNRRISGEQIKTWLEAGGKTSQKGGGEQ